MRGPRGVGRLKCTPGMRNLSEKAGWRVHVGKRGEMRLD